MVLKIVIPGFRDLLRNRVKARETLRLLNPRDSELFLFL